MLTFSEITEADLAHIIGIRERDDNLNQKLEAGVVSFSFAHKTFALGLASLNEPDIPQPERTGIRIIEVANEEFKFLYDVYGDLGAQMFQDNGLVNDYERAFETAVEFDHAGNNYTVQSLRIPALHIDALWLHDPDNRNNDKFIPVRSIAVVETNRIYNRNQFFTLVSNAAAARNPGDTFSGG